MSLHAEKLTGQVWATDSRALPEAMVDLANAGARGVPNDWAWATAIPAVQVSRLVPNSTRGVNVATGNFVPRPLVDKVSFHFDQKEALTGLWLRSVRLDYIGPAGYHDSTSGHYFLSMVVDAIKRKPPFNLTDDYLIELYMNGNRRPRRLTGEGHGIGIAKATKVKAGQYSVGFEFDGSHYPVRNLHLKPAAPFVPPAWSPHLDDEPEDMPFIEVPRSSRPAPRHVANRRNTNFGTPNQD
jgi:hypothetical protein